MQPCNRCPGLQVDDKDSEEHDMKDEAIVPSDMNLICDDDLGLILSRLPADVKFTMISDCCHSGSMLDHPEQQIAGNKDPNAPPGVQNMGLQEVMGMFFKDIPVSSAPQVQQHACHLQPSGAG
jgi:Caspase domain